MNNTIDENSLEYKIRIEQIKTLYQSMVSLLVINLAVSSMLVYGFLDVISHTTLGIWMGLMLLMIVVRAMFYFSYKNRFDPQHIKRYSYFIIIGSAASGVVWGLSGILLFTPDQLDYQLFLLLALLAMTGGSTFTLSIYLPAFYAYAPLTILPLAINLLLTGDSIHTALGIASLVHLAALISFNLKMNRSFKASLQMRYENIDLIEQLHHQKNEADRANLAKSKFLAAASHDLRQPLYASSLFTSVLEELVKEPEALRVVAQIKTSGESMKSMFNALLNISQLDAGVMHPEKTNFLLQPLLEALANDFYPLAKQKNLLIHWPTEVFAVYSDRELVEQILRNFISNAIRYTDKGSIRISCEVKNEQIIINVTDTGIGISEENQKTIFDEYKQIGNSERDRTKGLGLGLAIVKRTADLLQHDITVESQINQGSTFSIGIEQANIEDCVVKQDLVQQDKPEKISDTLIVVIDDDVSVLEGTRTLLQRWGCTVIAATDQEQAHTLTKQNNQIPDGIISDYRLRNNETGVTVIQSIHAAFHDEIPALIVTGDIEIDRLKDVDRSGIQMLPKPVSSLKLRTFLRHVEKFKLANA